MAEPATRAPAQERAKPLVRADFPYFLDITTRWMDNDAYGHVNNVVYYSYFDTAVNGWLMEVTGSDIRQLPQIGLVVETGCRYLSPISFPDELEVGIAMERIGNSSLVYKVAIFVRGAAEPAAFGRFVHVYVDAVTRQSVPVPAAIRSAVESLQV